MAAPFLDPDDIRRRAGGAGFERGAAYHREGMVARATWDEASRTLTGIVRGSGRNTYRCTIRIDPRHRTGPIASAVCSCPVEADCKHTVATMLASNEQSAPPAIAASVVASPAVVLAPAMPMPARPAAPAAPPAPTWRSLLDPPAVPSGPPLALGIELRQRAPYQERSWAPRRVEAAEPRALAARQDDLSLAIRPLVRSDATGAWIKGNVSWDAVRRPGSGFLHEHARWFAQLADIAIGARSLGPYADPGEWIALDTVDSGLLWPHLEAAAGCGIPFVTTAKRQSAVLAATASASLDIAAGAGGALRLSARLTVDGEPVAHAVVRPIGSHGFYVAGLDADPIPITLAPCELPEAVRTLLPLRDGVLVARDEKDEFLRDAVPRLRRRTTVTAGAGIALPPASEPVAIVTAAFGTGDVVDYRIEWSYPGLTRLPYAAAAHPDRDAAAEDRIREALEESWGSALPFAPTGRLEGVDAAELAARTLPAWQQLDGVRIEGNAPRRTYTELTGDPAISLTSVETTDPDWFDLGIIVTIDGRSIPFTPLFTALARGRAKLLLSDGAFFSLRHPALDRLKELIDEAAGIAEWETAPRISRYQTDLWADFEDLAEEAQPALAWRSLVEGLRSETSAPSARLPAGVLGELRPYQRAGFDWLAFLWSHRLGGILADDMGLGKTLQLLTLAAHVKEGGEPRPVLVVAPTSVLPTWASEAARFVPGLAVRTIEQTSGKSGVRVTDAAAGADLVITSYALARLDADEFAAVDWAVVILDEAQFAKNPQTKLHRALARLRAGMVVAATGTPLENSLTDLWALLALTAPGLFPSARRFREEYVKPIEQGKVPEDQEGGAFRSARLERLRRRIRPLMLRRTKELVAPDLPEKQEQLLRVALDAVHRALYDRALARERQKVLGLLDDLDRNRFIVFRSLTLLRLMSLAPVLVDPEHAHVGSTKLDALLERIVEVAAEGHRALVFSQFTSFLTLAAERLDAAGIRHAYLDGSTRRRAAVIDAFRRGDEPVFLISLKAGGFGLTLTEADYVFVLDPWWNPAAEAQAVDRTHRIGQTRTVFVYRMIAADTIEEKVMALQERKARLFQAVVDDDAMFSQALTADDIRGLLEA
ncbi:DEAD/DEAH box helicase [Microbacterium sp. SS28]|uniref:DEAD/DEAH box helicase n=1 Tax=Microbacterium sp. SS28 TaxID=2919948 RepID=UPI001FAA2523|nr:DEAD/DEAH box helicase [Microbacterium sp. SS28]